ncbi:hypothetical protein [Frankia sp. AgKG'84/4]|uniref:hypothetical protein n=1 Tax=Frankia sp. AgKG'84/4 TaxID=573490 RepID=UPI00200C3953|nr:hypothetical protein [Frankia sp. AgKG'84/4]MCL9794923.1 hypothetical protein [Frankia sp. AgKG'84/4]
MAIYAIRWVDHAREQRDSLPPEARAMLEEALRTLVRGPRSGTYDKRSDQWTASFDRGRGVILYTIEERWFTITLLRVVWLS